MLGPKQIQICFLKNFEGFNPTLVKYKDAEASDKKNQLNNFKVLFYKKMELVKFQHLKKKNRRQRQENCEFKTTLG